MASSENGGQLTPLQQGEQLLAQADQLNKKENIATQHSVQWEEYEGRVGIGEDEMRGNFELMDAHMSRKHTLADEIRQKDEQKKNHERAVHNMRALHDLKLESDKTVLPILSALNQSWEQLPHLEKEIVDAILGKIMQTNNGLLFCFDRCDEVLNKQLRGQMPILDFIRYVKFDIFPPQDTCKSLMKKIMENTPEFSEKAKQYLVYLFLVGAKAYRPYDPHHFYNSSSIDNLIRTSDFILTFKLNPESKNDIANFFVEEIRSYKMNIASLKTLCQYIGKLNPNLRQSLGAIVNQKLEENPEYYQLEYPAILNAILGRG